MSLFHKKHYILLQGGLGNQLYMLAYANFLKDQGQTNIRMISLSQKDNKGDTKDRKKRSLLTEFPKGLGIKHLFLSHRFYSFLLRLPKIPIYKTLWSKIVNIREEPAREWAVFHPIDSHIGWFNIHIGYFQAHQYINDNFKEKVNNTIKELVSNSTYTITENDVAIHIRRGDFFTNGNENIYSKVEGTYYLKALEYLSSKVSINKVYIFSDDFKAIEDDIKKIEAKYNVVLVNGQSVLEDFAMLQKFINFALGNSTFAWWGAMLANAKNVMVPKTPWKVEMKGMSPYPNHWTLIEN